MKRSGIVWTDYSGGNLNFVRRGKDDCRCSPGCAQCYVERIDARFPFLPDKTTVYPEKLAALRTQRFPDAFCRGVRRPRCFVCDTGDLFHESVPRDVIDRAFSIFMARPDVIWQVLTKRARRMKEFVDWWTWQPHGDPKIPEHIWLGVTAEDQQRADERIPLLLATPAVVRFVSVEPMLKPVDLFRSIAIANGWNEWCDCAGCVHQFGGVLNWVICGGESGPDARPMQPDWARSLRDQCHDTGVSFFMKQMSAREPIPADLMVRQFPEN